MTAPGLNPENMPVELLVLGGAVMVLFLAGMVVNMIIVVRGGYRTLLSSAPAFISSLPWNWMDAVTMLLSLVALWETTAAVLLLCRQQGWGPDMVGNPWFILASASIVPGAMLIPIYHVLRRHSLTMASGFNIRTHRILPSLRGGLVAYVAAFPLVVAATLLARQCGFDGQQDVIAVLTDETNPLGFKVGMCLLAGVVAPIWEEIVFRGIILHGAARHIGVGNAIILTSLLFAAIHFSMAAALPLFLLGIALSIAYLSTESLMTAIVLHGLFNSASLAILFLTHGIGPDVLVR